MQTFNTVKEVLPIPTEVNVIDSYESHYLIDYHKYNDFQSENLRPALYFPCSRPFKDDLSDFNAEISLPLHQDTGVKEAL